jgi:N-acetylglutamate synthase-like GNAT family acetyltransferase
MTGGNTDSIMSDFSTSECSRSPSGSTFLPPHCVLRRADRADIRELVALTRQLQRTAVPRAKWQNWAAGMLIGLMLALVTHYPSVVVAVGLSTMPLWLAIGITVLIAGREQRRNWDQYWVVVYQQPVDQQQVIGCVRLDRQRDHSELYDLFVLPEWRAHGVGRALVSQLIQPEHLPIYLASLSPAIAFYARLGFRPIALQELPPLLATRLSLTSPRYQRAGLQAMTLKSTSNKPTGLGDRHF